MQQSSRTPLRQAAAEGTPTVPQLLASRSARKLLEGREIELIRWS